MKRRLYIKLLLGYLLFGSLAFIILFFFTKPMAEKKQLQFSADNQHREAANIAGYVQTDYNRGLSLEQVQEHLTMFGNFLGSEIWIVDNDGRMLLDSTDSSVVSPGNNSAQRKISGFSISDFGDNCYMTGDFYGLFREPMLTAYAPILSGFTLKGYLLVHHPLQSVYDQTSSFFRTSLFSTCLLFLATFLILIIFTFAVYIPIRKITRAANAYARGDFTGKINIHTDDELGYLSDTLNYMAEALATQEEDQRKFISNVSHDFRSPLTSIKGYIEAIKDGTIPAESQGRYLDIILFETERLNKLTEELLELNRFGGHGAILNARDFDINRMIKNTVLTFKGVCQKKNLTFTLILTETELFVFADPDKIQRVLYNLIDNAVKFSKTDTDIVIETSIKNEKLLISVKDSGIGIPEEDINKIWDRFYKTDLSRGKDKKGTGLGLSIVKEIIQAHGEHITVVSTEGAGTEFSFSLPLVDHTD